MAADLPDRVTRPDNSARTLPGGMHAVHTGHLGCVSSCLATKQSEQEAQSTACPQAVSTVSRGALRQITHSAAAGSSGGEADAGGMPDKGLRGGALTGSM